MIYVEMEGRCGNQLFRYAFSRYIQEQVGGELVLNFNSILNRNDQINGWKNELENFNVVPYKVYNKKGKILFNETSIYIKVLCMFYLISLKLKSKYNRSEQYRSALKFQNILEKKGVYWLREGYYQYKIYKNNNYYISGGFECEKFFDEIKDKLKIELTPIRDVLKKNIDLYRDICMNESVCISIRRGDFLNKENSKSFAVCNKEYYIKAQEIMIEKIKNPKFFIFSDDIEWCRKNIKFKEDVTWVSQDNPVFETLRLMYSCKHFIISNSTFSWWGQYLSENNNKIVISPKRWNNDDFESPLISNKWILVDTDTLEVL